ncbi:hypothetical protein F751_0556 [Auxenochlorella protothecoides]|uniref:Proton pump-interactor 1 n=1 Tax=Auxenochlorella protothecoides TaxID=3075 RepID=A0A087SIH5_AUXPR|nr:hypothetical protein F751_0556 [Auxenochlorella protothecoides]KFM25529.1 hypothetical protein F751_0556 [Auxenochlorella protothecoides]
MDTDALEESEGATGSTTNSLGGTRHADALAVHAVERGPRRLWLVRVPKPPEVTALAALEQELAAYTQQVKLLNESASVKKVARDDARKDTQAAREAYRLCRDAYNACMEVVTPLREAARGSAGAGPRRLRESYPELEVWSVAELDERLAGMEYRLQHESVPLAEEKRLVAGLKRLAGQRARAEEEARALREERAAQKEVLDGFWEAERAVDAEVEAILAERRRLKELQDEAYARVSEVRRAHRERKDAYYSSRRHSTGVRALLREPGGVEKARAMCGEQVDRQLAVLRDNDDYRAEYLTLIEQQRGRPSTWEEGEEAGNGARRGHSRQPSLPLTEEETKERAQGTIAAVLEQARSRAPRAEPAHPEPERAAPEPESAFELPAAVAARARCETAAAEADRAAEAERQRACVPGCGRWAWRLGLQGLVRWWIGAAARFYRENEMAMVLALIGLIVAAVAYMSLTAA